MAYFLGGPLNSQNFSVKFDQTVVEVTQPYRIDMAGIATDTYVPVKTYSYVRDQTDDGIELFIYRGSSLPKKNLGYELATHEVTVNNLKKQVSRYQKKATRANNRADETRKLLRDSKTEITELKLVINSATMSLQQVLDSYGVKTTPERVPRTPAEQSDDEDENYGW